MSARVVIEPGTVFHEWTVLGYDDQAQAHAAKYWCKCTCGTKRSVFSHDLRAGTSKRCTSCGPRGRLGFEPSGLIPGFYLSVLMKGARERNLEVSITTEDLSDVWENQGGKCALTGWDLTLRVRAKDYGATASVDRISSVIGYTRDNIQWLHRDINRLKNNYTEERFFEMCQAIVAYKDQTVQLRKGSRPWLRGS